MMMRRSIALLLAVSAPAASQTASPVVQSAPMTQSPALAAPVWQPAAAYITPGQDEAGYRAWFSTALWHKPYVSAFNDYLEQYGVGGVVPTWQLLRTATSWQRCGGQPFEVPPTTEWPHIVQTLRYIQGFVVPAIGPVEAVSGYRNPALNACAGGAPESAHKQYSAIDLVPLRPIERPQLMRALCAAHARRGSQYDVGLGFYSFLRFHVDTTRYRRWGADTAPCPSIIRPSDVATVALAPPTPPTTSQPQAGTPQTATPVAAAAGSTTTSAPPAPDTDGSTVPLITTAPEAGTPPKPQ